MLLLSGQTDVNSFNVKLAKWRGNMRNIKH